jgi:hypothetical protein
MCEAIVNMAGVCGLGDESIDITERPWLGLDA